MIALPANRMGVNRRVSVPVGALAAIFLLLLGWLFLFWPVYLEFSGTVWRREENAHAPFLMAICLGLSLSALRSCKNPNPSFAETLAGVLLLFAFLWAFVFARATQFEFLLSALQGLIGAAMILIFFGFRGLKACSVPLALTLYLIIWPGWLLDGITLPLKLQISRFVAETLYVFGLPTAYEGAIITVGQYKLLIADACSGVNSMIALTSIGVVYIYAASRLSDKGRPRLANLILCASLLPIAYCANVLRVAVLVLLTYYFGHDVGQGFLHEAAGLFLFCSALTLTFILDSFLLAVPKSGRESYLLSNE